MLVAIILATILGSLAVNAQNECQCGAFIVNDATGYSEWFHTFNKYYHVECGDLEGCQKDCYALGVNVTNNGDLTKPFLGLNITFGDYACQSLVHDVDTGARVEIEYQVCSSPWYDTGLVTTQPFCCINGDFPEDGSCP